MATDVLGTQELVVDGKTDFLMPLLDIDAMVEKIKLLATDSGLRKRIGARGLNRVNSNFNDLAILETLHDFYVQAEPGKRP